MASISVRIRSARSGSARTPRRTARHRPRIGCRFPQRSSGAARAANLINAHIAFAPPPAAAGQRPNDDRMEAQPRSISPVNGPADRHELSSLHTLSRSCCRRKPATENPSSRTVGPPHGIRADAVDLDGGNAPARPQQPDILTFEGAASGRDKAFLIEYCGDLLVHFTGPV